MPMNSKPSLVLCSDGTVKSNAGDKIKSGIDFCLCAVLCKEIYCTS